MDQKRRVGIRRGSFLKLMEDNLNITDFETLNQIFDIMLEERKTMDQVLTPILKNYVMNAPGVHGDYTIGDLNHLIGEFQTIVHDLQRRKNQLIKNRL